MKFTTTKYGNTLEILGNDHYVGRSIKVAASAATNDVVKAGTPMAADGTKATDSNAYGILLWDVNVANNPNGTVVVHGWIETAKAKKNSGITITDGMKATMPMIQFI